MNICTSIQFGKCKVDCCQNANSQSRFPVPRDTFASEISIKRETISLQYAAKVISYSFVDRFQRYSHESQSKTFAKPFHLLFKLTMTLVHSHSLRLIEYAQFSYTDKGSTGRKLKIIMPLIRLLWLKSWCQGYVGTDSKVVKTLAQ